MLTKEDLRAADKVTVAMAAQYLGASELFVRQGILQHKLPFGDKVGNRYIIHPQKLIEYHEGLSADNCNCSALTQLKRCLDNGSISANDVFDFIYRMMMHTGGQAK